MKFSFEAESYRKNLSDEIKEKRLENKEEAREFLEKERGTLAYRVAEDIHTVLRNISKVAKDQGAPESTMSIEANNEISTKIIKVPGESGHEHILEIHTIDISNKIPVELKLQFDLSRLQAIDKRVPQVGTGLYKDIHKDYTHVTTLVPQIQNAMDAHLFSRDLELLDKLLLVDKEHFGTLEILLRTEYSIGREKDPDLEKKILTRLKKYLSEEEMERLMVIRKYQATIDYRDLELATIDKLTRGAFFSKDSLIHVVAGDNPDFKYLEYPHLLARFPHAQDGITPSHKGYGAYEYSEEKQEGAAQEIPLNIEKLASSDLWFSSGRENKHHMYNGMVVVVCNPQSKIFKEKLRSISAYDKKGKEELDDSIKSLKLLD
jgi:hypothetical protein